MNFSYDVFVQLLVRAKLKYKLTINRLSHFRTKKLVVYKLKDKHFKYFEEKNFKFFFIAVLKKYLILVSSVTKKK